MHQLKLYKEWPDFHYWRADCLNGTLRSIIPKAANDGAQYLLIDNDPINELAGSKGTIPMGCARPQEPLILDKNLSTEIVDFLKFKAGRIFEEDSTSTNDNWTKMIWDMLRIARLKASRRKNSGLSNFPRMSSGEADGLCYYLSDSQSLFTDLHQGLKAPNDQNDKYINDEENSGLSVVLIESYQQQERG